MSRGTPLRTPVRRRWTVAAGLALSLAVTAVLAARSAPAAGPPAIRSALSAAVATAGLTQVPRFGSNPGGLQMYAYVPATARASAPLVVALHGCTQNAAGYYQGPGWPKYADQWGFDLVFPQQTPAGNAAGCFDWWTPSDDRRGAGEAESIMQMIQYMQATHSISRSRIYITGASAGGAMTADLLADYPDVFAGGAVDSGPPAQCATTIIAALSCGLGTARHTPAQWGALARGADPGYTGPYPKVAIWQGTADPVVNVANATDGMQQWTNLWGISQTPSSTHSLTGGTTETSYDGPGGTPAVETYLIAGMGHALAVNPGPAASQCGQTGPLFADRVCSTYYTALFWGLP